MAPNCMTQATSMLLLAWGATAWLALLGWLGVVTCIVLLVRVRLGITRLRQHLGRYRRGDFEPPLRRAGPLGLDAAVDQAERLVAGLREHLERESQQHHELETVLRSMSEGVLLVDAEPRVVRLNPAAERLLGLDRQAAPGRPLTEVARHAGLLRVVRQALASDEPVVADLVVHELPPEGGADSAATAPAEIALQAHGAALRDAPGRRVGAVIVLHDVTRLRTLERIRRDFVANVSHELRTPVTAIKGFSETLGDDLAMPPEDAQRFLKIIAHQADRLTQLVDDLLSLARIEQAAERHQIELESADLSDVVAGVIESCRLRAQEKRIELVLESPAALELRFSPPLVEQALTNLLDNAIKYSGEATTIRTVVTTQPNQVCVAVHDQGPGIAPQHLPRLFERFYRVDRARSRAVGGTGLGLAIVKHVARAHGGDVAVESTVGKGSVFCLTLPLRSAGASTASLPA